MKRIVIAVLLILLVVSINVGLWLMPHTSYPYHNTSFDWFIQGLLVAWSLLGVAMILAWCKYKPGSITK